MPAAQPHLRKPAGLSYRTVCGRRFPSGALFHFPKSVVQMSSFSVPFDCLSGCPCSWACSLRFGCLSRLCSLCCWRIFVPLSLGKCPNMSGLLTFILKNAAHNFSSLFVLSFVTFCNIGDLYKFHVVNSSLFPFDLHLERLPCPYVMQTYNKTFWCFS